MIATCICGPLLVSVSVELGSLELGWGSSDSGIADRVWAVASWVGVRLTVGLLTGCGLLLAGLGLY